jgi:hypothetical protein
VGAEIARIAMIAKIAEIEKARLTTDSALITLIGNKRNLSPQRHGESPASS